MELDARALVGLDELKLHLTVDASNHDHDDDLIRLANTVSEMFYDLTRREFVKKAENPQTRLIDLIDRNVDWDQRQVSIGDLTNTTGLQLRILERNGTLIEDVDESIVVALPREREPHEPITELWFLGGYPTSVSLPRNHLLEVTGNYGFPKIPERVRHFAIVQVGIWHARDVRRYAKTFKLETQRYEQTPRELDDAVRKAILRYKIRNFR